MIGSGDNAVIPFPPPNLPPFTWKSICVSVPARSISKQTHKRSLVWRSTSPMPTVVQVPAHILTPDRLSAPSSFAVPLYWDNSALHFMI